MQQDERTRLGSGARFGYEWATYSGILPESRDQLQRWLGALPLSDFRGRSVLDVGCGMGRNAHWMALEGAKRVVGVDVDPQSLQAARRNLQPHPSVEIRQGSVYELDSAQIGTFDLVTCIGVLHHLSDPEAALRSMWGCVAPGGTLVLWCYAREGNRLLLPAIQVFRAVGSRIPIRATHGLAKATTAAVWPLLQVLPFRTPYYRNLRRLSYRNVESIIFDQMLPTVARYWSRQDMERLLQPFHGMRALEFVQGNSWSARVTRPA